MKVKHLADSETQSYPGSCVLVAIAKKFLAWMVVPVTCQKKRDSRLSFDQHGDPILKTSTHLDLRDQVLLVQNAGNLGLT